MSYDKTPNQQDKQHVNDYKRTEPSRGTALESVAVQPYPE